MASEKTSEKIGIVIGVEGEKEFKQAVTACNKSLGTLKSEMSLVKAQSEGQANTLESLRKKHDVLARTLEAHEEKEKAVREGLEHAKTVYQNVGMKLEDLRGKYEAAKEELAEMGKAADVSAGDLKKQEKAVGILSDALAKSESNYQTAGNRVKDWEKSLNTAQAQTIKATKALNENAAYMREAEQSADKCATSIDSFGKKIRETENVTWDFATTLKNNLQNTLIDLAKNTFSEITGSVMDFESAQKQLQASTGATAAEMRQYKTVMNDLHSSNYGEDIRDVADSVSLVKQYTNELDPGKLKDMTENGIAMRDVFGMDLGETIRGVDSLVTNMGLSSEKAFDLMAKGAQNGLDKSGELADNIAEYGQLWSQAGFSAEEMFSILNNGMKSGAYNLDKVNDFVKEFGISLADGRIEDSLDSFSDGTRNLFYQWKSGRATTRDVFYSVISDLSGMTDKQKALTVASSTWSALGEDNALAVLTALDDVNTAYEDVRGTMESIKDVRYDTLESRIQTLGKKFQTEVGTPVVEKALPMLEKGLDAVADNLGTVISLTGGIAAGVGTYKAVTAAVTLFSRATEGAAEKQTLFNMASNANPVVLVTTALVAAGTAFALYAQNAGEASEKAKLLAEINDRVVDSANGVTESVHETVRSYQESTAEMEAQGEYARTLADRIGKLSDRQHLSAEETSVLKSCIAELNSVVPELNLAYDEQTEKLSMSTEEIYRNIEASEKQIAQQAAQEYAIELIKKKTELEIESIKLQNQMADSQEALNAATDAAVGKADSWLYYLSDERREYDLLYDAVAKNREAIDGNRQAKEELAAEEAAVKTALEELGVSYDTVTGSVNTTSAAEQEAAAVQGEVAAVMSGNAAVIGETYQKLQESITGALESQMNMFEAFDAGTEISTETLLANMQSQISGVENWAENLSMLADRGINENLLQYLADMGPEGAAYVAAFAKMSDDELKKASDMWAQSLDMKSGVDKSISGAVDSIYQKLPEISGAAEKAGRGIPDGMTEGITAASGKTIETAENMSLKVIEKMAEGAGTHSPSWKTEEIGRYVVDGLVKGMNGSSRNASSAAEKLSASVVKNMSDGLAAPKFVKAGRSVASGLASGINGGRSLAAMAAGNMASMVQQNVSEKLVPGRFTASGRNVASGLASGINSGRPAAVASASALASGVHAAASRTESLYQTGYYLSAGMASGISAGRSYVINSVASLCTAAVTTAKTRLRINSPSKVFDEIGGYAAEGFGVGYKNRIAGVNRMINESMDYRYRGAGQAGSTAGLRAAEGPEKITVEIPVYIDRNYSRTEIVEIAMDGIRKNRQNHMKAKGGAVYV